MQEGAVQFLDVGTNSPDSSGDPTSFENNLTTTDSRIRYQGGMSYAQFMTVVEDIRWEPPWRRQADKCSDYYDGNQLDSEALQRMQERGIAPLVYNITKPVIDVCIGMEAKNRTDYRVSEGGAAPEEWTQVAAALNHKLGLAERKSLADKACADAYAAQLKAGLGWVGVNRETNPFEYPYRVEYIHRREMWWDWHDMSRDLRDSRYLVRSRWVDLDIAKNLFHGDARLVDYVFNGWGGYNNFEDELLQKPDLSMDFEQERVFVLPDFEWRNTARKRIRFFECWYRLWERGYVMRLPNNRSVRFDDNKVAHQVAVASGTVALEKATFPRVRLAMWMGPHRMFDIPSPYPHHRFPYVPFWGFREDMTNIPYGLMRSMMHPQDEVNARRSKMLWQLSARRLIADSDAIDQTSNTIDQVLDELSRPDAAVFLNPERKNRDADAFRIEENTEVGKQQFELYLDSREMVNKAAGIYQSMLGDGGKGQPKAGIAINSLIEQGITTLAGINDNYQYGRMRVGELLLELVKEDLAAGGEQRMTLGSGSGRYTIYLNKPMVNADNGIQELENNVKLAEVELELDEVPSTPTQRQQDFMLLTELVKSLPPEVQAATVDFVIGASSLKDRAKIAERVRTMLNLPDEVPPGMEAEVKAQQQKQAQEQADITKRAAEAEIRVKEAKADKDSSESAKVMAEIEMLRNAEENPEIQKLRDDLAKLTQQHQQTLLEGKQKEIDLAGELERERAQCMIAQENERRAAERVKMTDAVTGEHANKVKAEADEKIKATEAQHAERAKIMETHAKEKESMRAETEAAAAKRADEFKAQLQKLQDKYEAASEKNVEATTKALTDIASQMKDVMREISALSKSVEKLEADEGGEKPAGEAKPTVVFEQGAIQVINQPSGSKKIELTTSDGRKVTGEVSSDKSK